MPPIVSGVLNLFQAAEGWLLVLIPVVGGVMLGYHGLMKAMAGGDAMTAETHNKAMKNTIVASAIAEAAMATVAFILPYFKG